MPAPSYAPIRVGSISCSARFPLRVASHPTVASSGRRSTENFMFAGQPVDADSKDRRDARADRRAIERQAEEANYALPPRVEPAGRMRIGIDDGGSRADTLQTDRLPHQDHFRVNSGADDEQVARLSVVDGLLNRSESGDCERSLVVNNRWRLSADGYRDRVNGLLAVAGGDHELTAIRGRTAVLGFCCTEHCCNHLPGRRWGAMGGRSNGVICPAANRQRRCNRGDGWWGS